MGTDKPSSLLSATLQDLATLWSKKPPGVKVKVVLHGDEEIAKGWLGECTKDPKYKLPEDVEIVIDGPDLALRKELGFGWTSLAHFLGPGSLGGVFKLKRERGVANRFPETGNRWVPSFVLFSASLSLFHFSAGG